MGLAIFSESFPADDVFSDWYVAELIESDEHEVDVGVRGLFKLSGLIKLDALADVICKP
jgi:hypothetical protein